MNAVVPSKQTISVKVFPEYNPVQIKDGTAVARVILDVNPVAKGAGVKPVDLRFVIDHSGSMRNRATPNTHVTKLQVVKGALSQLVRNLTPTDNVSAVAFSNDPVTLLEHCQFDGVERASLLHALAGLEPYNGTYFADAFEQALSVKQPATIVFFTDGRSSDHRTDHTRLAEYADKMRKLGHKLIIYGTGPDYDWRFLQQLAIRAGNGSFVHHVLSVDGLLSHMRGELAFMRGTVLTDVIVSGWTHSAEILEASRFVPVRQELKHEDDHLNVRVLDPNGSFNAKAFVNKCGSLDRMRGQRFYFEIKFDRFQPGEHKLLTVQVTGKNEHGLPFDNQLSLPIILTRLSPTQKPHPEVERIHAMVMAEKLAALGQYDDASQIYTDMGEHMLAAEMQTLIQMGAAGDYDYEDISRSATSVTAGAQSTIMMGGDIQAAFDRIGESSDT